MKLTRSQILKIRELESHLRISQERAHRLSDKLWDFLEPLVDQHDLELDQEIEQILTCSSYAQFEVRIRIRHLIKAKAQEEEVPA